MPEVIGTILAVASTAWIVRRQRRFYRSLEPPTFRSVHAAELEEFRVPGDDIIGLV